LRNPWRGYGLADLVDTPCHVEDSRVTTLMVSRETKYGKDRV
jgi:hypothetical protein